MIKYQVCENLEKTGLVNTCFTEKFEGHWRIYSLNENMEDLQYYDALSNMFNKKPSDMIRITQKHTNNIIVVTKDMAGEGVVKPESKEICDGMITNEKGVMLCTIEADCTPVYILDTDKKAIGMVHSGWRGTVGKISVNAINMMNKHYGTNVKDLLIYLGPSICKDCYEVGQDVYDEFSSIYDKNDLEKFFKRKNNKYLLDVADAVRIQLIEIGVKEENIMRSKYCTYHNTNFDSWRRDQDKTGHMLTMIMLK